MDVVAGSRFMGFGEFVVPDFGARERRICTDSVRTGPVADEGQRRATVRENRGLRPRVQKVRGSAWIMRPPL